MVEERGSIEHLPSRELDRSLDIFSETQIEEYRKGCETIALNLDDTVDKIIRAGKKPTILIPSRGAVPIVINALDSLKKDDPDNRLVNPGKIKFYPFGIFNYLSNGRIEEKLTEDIESEVDVVLYPFTADVSTTNQNAEGLAKMLRKSCSRAFVDLVYNDRMSFDLRWNFFLLKKLKEDVYSDFMSTPKDIIGSLQSLSSSDDRQIILVDTVISGRAVANITEAFRNSGHPVTPVLSVDTSKGGKVIDRHKAGIQRNMSTEFIAEEPFTEFPLISEDKGAALLGVSALNFSNFNVPNFFHEVDRRYDTEAIPQSCLWVIPPKNYHIELFKSFIDRCSGKLNMQSPDDVRKWEADSQQIRYLLKNRLPDESGIRGMIKAQNNFTVTESSSHIVTVTLEDRDARDWVREFSKSK